MQNSPHLLNFAFCPSDAMMFPSSPQGVFTEQMLRPSVHRCAPCTPASPPTPPLPPSTLIKIPVPSNVQTGEKDLIKLILNCGFLIAFHPFFP